MTSDRGHRVALLGSGLIAEFYAATLHGRRSRDSVAVVCSRSADRAAAFAERWSVPATTTSVADAIARPDVDTVVVALPNDLHLDAITGAAAAGKAVLCTKPLARSAAEAREALSAIEA